MRFVVMLSSRDEKPRGGGTDYDPLAIENVPASMVVKERIFDDYALILNKFPAFRGHALLASLDPIDQAARLTKWDLDALHRCATAAKALGFYNSHDVAGSSQVHRHFQLVPVDSIAAVVGRRNFFFPGIFDQVHELPREFWRWSSKTPFFPVVRRLPALHGVAHGLVQLPRRATFDIDFARDGGFADALLRSYVALATDLGILGDVQEAPHNILLSEAWILVVKRAKATARGVAVNGLAFAAILLARDADVFDALVRDRRPLSVLRDVSAAPPPP
ncbi:hypothetical protein CTAYLR_008397 [Chrysophaeum taylorii]|uniref:Phosphorylase n=1 Tax=Chrysophaeum taylorii TaxID=2483200 RepID=A0AAD7UIY4_9STRA|nr:hypothetical protein CTAYLR_008397 [Chrysophaeum taylorii]